MKKIKFMAFTAFTIAEVLIVLGIVGIIAEITLPALYASFETQVYKTAFKKNYSVLNQVLMNYYTDNGRNFDFTDTSFWNYFSKTKICNSSITEGCWHANNTATCLNGSNFNGIKAGMNILSNKPGAILNDGTLISMVSAFPSASASISVCSTSYPVNEGDKNPGFIIDVNGFKAPNVVGKDILHIQYVNNRLTTFGSGTDCNVSNIGGLGCAYSYLMP